MSEEKVYKQTYSLEEDESDSESSVEVQYIQASDLPADELERILAKYRSSLEPDAGQDVAKQYVESHEVVNDCKGGQEDNFTEVPAPSWLRDAYDENTNDEPKPKTIVYKTTYRTSNEELSGSEASQDEDSNEELDSNEITYKTLYRTFRTRDSSPEVYNDGDGADYKAKEEWIERFKKKQRQAEELNLVAETAPINNMNQEPDTKEVKDYKEAVVTSTERHLSPTVLFSGGANEPSAAASIGMMQKHIEIQPTSKVLFSGANDPSAAASIGMMQKCIEIQPTPGGKFIKIPIPTSNQQKFKHSYRAEWESEPHFKDWIQPLLDDSMYAYCKFCKCKLIAHKKSLRDHSKTKKHRKNVFDATGVWNGSNTEQPNYMHLMPRARRRTEKILLTNYDGSSLDFGSSELNVRSINDPLLPIS